MKKRVIIPTVLAGVLGSVILIQQTEISSSAEKLDLLSATEAKELALKEFKGDIIDFEFDRDHTPHYEFEIVNKTEKAEITVDAQSGTVFIQEREALTKQLQTNANPVTKTVDKAVSNVEKNVDTVVANTQMKAEDTVQKIAPASKETALEKVTPQTSIITKAQAIAIAQAKASGTVVDVDYDDDDFEYDIEIKNGHTEYEIEIDARTGTIIKFEKDIDDDRDDD